jgi:stage II sporulation protein D
VDFLDRSGHVKRILITTNQRQYRMPGPKFRTLLNRIFGQRRILSNFYEIKMQGNKLAIQGRGLGHAVGMCQWGARGMAQHGFTYKEILEHYFKGTEINNFYNMPAKAAGKTVPATKKP